MKLEALSKTEGGNTKMTKKKEKLQKLFPEDLFEVTRRLSEKNICCCCSSNPSFFTIYNPCITFSCGSSIQTASDI